MIPIEFSEHQLETLSDNGQGEAFFLVMIENWDHLIEKAGQRTSEAILARFSGLIHTHFGSEFQSLSLSDGEFFVIVSFSSQRKLLEKCNDLRHALEQVVLANDVKLEVSICLAKNG